MCSTNKSDKELSNGKCCEKCGKESFCMFYNKEGIWICDSCMDKERNGYNTKN